MSENKTNECKGVKDRMREKWLSSVRGRECNRNGYRIWMREISMKSWNVYINIDSISTLYSHSLHIFTRPVV